MSKEPEMIHNPNQIPRIYAQKHQKTLKRRISENFKKVKYPSTIEPKRIKMKRTKRFGGSIYR